MRSWVQIPPPLLKSGLRKRTTRRLTQDAEATRLGDLRRLIGGEAVPFSLARVPKRGESRGNLAAGGTGHAQPLTGRDREIAESLAPLLLSRGLFLVGLDVIGDNLTEINVTSPTCFREIADQTGFDVAGLFIQRLEALVAGADGQAASASASAA